MQVKSYRYIVSYQLSIVNLKGFVVKLLQVFPIFTTKNCVCDTYLWGLSITGMVTSTIVTVSVRIGV